MSRSRASLSLLVVLTILATMAPASAGTVREDYILGPVGDTDGLCRMDRLNPTGLNIGTVCFAKPSATSATLRIEDATGLPVAGNYVFVTSSGAAIGGAIDFCQRTTLAVPSNASRLVVYIAGPAWGPTTCLETGSPGIGTNGTVKLIT